MNAQHESPARRRAEEHENKQALSPLDGALLAILVAAMTVASLTGRREAMYACFAAAAGWLLARLAVRPRGAKSSGRGSRKSARRPEGAPGSFPQRLMWALETTPRGYGIGMIGLGVAFFGLGGDIIWHTVFGVEGGIARVIAPFHLFLFTGAGLLLTSPLRATWASSEYDGKLTLKKAMPPILALTLIVTLAVFLFQWMTAFMDWKPSVDIATLPVDVRHNDALIQALQMVQLSRIFLTTATLVGGMLLAIRRFRLPFGAMTIVFTIPALLSEGLRNLGEVGIVFAAMATGLFADALIKALKPSAQRTGMCRAIAFLVSLFFAAIYLIVLAAAYNKRLPFDLTVGTIGLTGIVGLALSAIAMPPGAASLTAAPEAEASEATTEPVEEPAAWTPTWDTAEVSAPVAEDAWAPTWESTTEPEPVADEAWTPSWATEPEPVAEEAWTPSWASEPEPVAEVEPEFEFDFEPEVEPEPEPVAEVVEMQPIAAERRRPADAADLRFATRIAGATASRENPIEAVALLSLLRGTPGDRLGERFEPALSDDEVTGLCQDVAERHHDWAAKPLDRLDVVYLFLEAVRLPAPGDSVAEQDLLGAWGITRHGKRVLLGLRTGSRDRATAWGALGADLVERGMHPPALVVADGAPGVWRVIRELWPDAATQQCVSCALDDACEGLSSSERRDLRARFTAALESARSAAEAQENLEAVLDDFRDEAPARMAVLGHRLERLTAHVAFPREHRRRLRSATVLDRALGWLASERPAEQVPGGASDLALIWAVLDLGTRSARRMPMSIHAADQLDQLRRRPLAVHEEASSATEA